MPKKQSCRKQNCGTMSETAEFENGKFVGHRPGTCTHYSYGSHRAWCPDCTESCYPHGPCIRCERAIKAEKGVMDLPELESRLSDLEKAAVENKDNLADSVRVTYESLLWVRGEISAVHGAVDALWKKIRDMESERDGG